MDFPTLRDGMFPHIDNVDVYRYQNELDYSRFDTDQAHITVCHVPWDVGLVHVGDRFIEGLGNVVYFPGETERNAYISNLSDKFEFDTKYRRYHLELEIKLPIPVDRCAEYNYVAVHHEPIPNASSPVEYESATEGVKDWFFFIRELKYLAPNTTYAVLMLDVWQTFIYKFGISGVMLERGHFPMSQSDTDDFLSDPMANSAFLLDPDIDASESSISASDDVHVFDDDVLFALFTSFDFAGSYGVKHQSGWKTPSIGIAGKSGYPSQTCIAVETSDAQSLLDYLQTDIPQALECVQACAFVPRELVEVSGTFSLGSLTVYNIAGKKSSIAHELSRADYAYPEQYAELAKLYTAPYANIVITDGADTITIAPQTVSGNSIEIITDIQLIADALRMRSQTVHAGGSNISLGFERLTSKTFTASGSIQDLSILRDIPTYSIYVDNSVIYDNGNYWLNEQRKAEAAAQLADTTDRATASKDNAYASALASKDNAYASAQTANANAYEQAQAQNIIDLANAATAKADATANASASLNDAKDSADTAKTNADAAALADKQNADASAWAEQTNSNASALADKQNADSNAWAEQTNSNASALADYTNRNSSAFAVKTDADEEGNTKNANAALNVAANSLINSYATTDATSQANYNISYNALALAADNGYTNDTANAQADAQIQSAAVSVAGNAIGAAATGAMAGSVIPGVGTVAGAVAGVISAIPNAAEVAANTAIGVNLSITQAGLAIANASSKESSANTTMSSKTATSNHYSTASTDAGNNLIADTAANEAALIQANAQRDYACDIDNSQRTYDTEVNNATNTYSAETSNAQNTYDTLVKNATNTYSAETSNAQNTYNIRTQSNTRDNDTAHAIADRDYSIAIGIADRDNTTAVDNADLAKLTAESIADRSQATDNANADRSYAAATGNADRDYNTSIGIAQRDNTVQLAAIDADIAQAALKAPYAVCVGSVQDAGAETPNYLDIQIRTMQPSDIRRIGDEFLRFGYAYRGYVSDPDFTIMPKFTYWQCSEIFIANLSIPDAYADQIRYLLIGGVTVWSDPAFIGNTSIYDNVIGG